MSDEPATRIVAIVGGSGAGKSWLTERLQRLFGAQAARLSLDDFYRDRSHLPAARRARINYDHPRAIDWARVEACLRECRAGRPTRLPRYDFKTHTRSAAEPRWQPRPLVLFEGLWLLLRPPVRRLFDVTIFIESPAALRLRRRLARDVAERGRSRASVRRQFAATVAPMHERFVAPQKRWAQVVLNQPLGEADVYRLADQLCGWLPGQTLRPARRTEQWRPLPRAPLGCVSIHE